MKLMSLGLRNQITFLPEIFQGEMLRRADPHVLTRYELKAEHREPRLACMPP